MASYSKDPALGEVIGLMDGDRRNKSSEHENAFKTHIGGQLSEQQKAWMVERVCFYPEDIPPEGWLWRVGRNSADFQHALAAQLNTEPVIIAQFFEGAAPTDFHDLPYELGRRVGIEEDRAIIGLCNAAVRTQPALQEVLTFITSRLNGGRSEPL